MNQQRHRRQPGRGRAPTIGIDIGRVIIAGGTPAAGPDTDFFGHDHDAAMRTPVVPGAFEGVATLVERFEGRAWLVSKCGPRIRDRSLAWLEHHRFWSRTGLDSGQVRFCRERRDKAIHAERLGLTHFVDDRFDVLRHLVDLVDHLYLFGPQKPRTGAEVEAMTPTPTWSHVLAEANP